MYDRSGVHINNVSANADPWENSLPVVNRFLAPGHRAWATAFKRSQCGAHKPVHHGFTAPRTETVSPATLPLNGKAGKLPKPPLRRKRLDRLFHPDLAALTGSLPVRREKESPLQSAWVWIMAGYRPSSRLHCHYTAGTPAHQAVSRGRPPKSIVSSPYRPKPHCDPQPAADGQGPNGHSREPARVGPTTVTEPATPSGTVGWPPRHGPARSMAAPTRFPAHPRLASAAPSVP